MSAISDQLAQFAAGYIECGLWCDLMPLDMPDNGETGAGNEWPEWVDKLSAEAETAILAECAGFLAANYADLLLYAEQHEEGVRRDESTPGPWAHAGHDFWLTRNGHGAGFWDRGLGELGTRLTSASEPYGEANLYVGDDGKVYAS